MNTLPAPELLKRLIQFPSLSHQEKEIADFVQAYVEGAGLPVRRLDNNVYFTLGEGGDRLLLNSHLDVVPASAHHPYPPFEAAEADGQIFGRGSVDAKASVATMMTAVLELARDGYLPPEGQVIVALTSCEEVGGGYNGLEHLRPQLPELSAAIVGEPTDLQPCVGQKGLLILEATAHGKTAHAARAHLGENAIVKASRDLQRLTRFEFGREDPILGKPTITPTTIEGGSARNVVPERCSYWLDIRSTPAYSHAEITDLLKNELESEIRVHSERFIPVATPVEHRIVKACLSARTDAVPFGSPTASDWIFLADLPVVKLGPGASQLSHTPDEHIAILEVQEAVSVYKGIIKAYFQDRQ